MFVHKCVIINKIQNETCPVFDWFAELRVRFCRASEGIGMAKRKNA